MLVDIGVDNVLAAVKAHPEMFRLINNDTTNTILDTISVTEIGVGVYIIPMVGRRNDRLVDLGRVPGVLTGEYGTCHSLADVFRKYQQLKEDSKFAHRYYITISPRYTNDSNQHYVNIARFVGTDRTPQPIHWFYEVYRLAH